jgi:hypothetical protein
MRRIALALLVPASLAFAGGPLSLGIKGGVPFTDAFHTATSGNVSYVTNNKYWTLGPELDVNLPFGLGIEVDALYRRLNFESTTSVPSLIAHAATTANAWDFPLLLKWKLAPGPIRPYISAGPTFRGLSNVKQVVSFFEGTPSPVSERPAELQNRFNTGFTVGGGVQLLGHISPEIRYTRWGWNTFLDTSGLLKSNPDQLEFLVGLTF